CPACLRRRSRKAPTMLLNFLQTRQVAADTEATKTFELPVTVKHRQTRHLNRQPLVGIVDSRKQDETAEGFKRWKCPGDVGLWIEVESVGDINPGAVE